MTYVIPFTKRNSQILTIHQGDVNIPLGNLSVTDTFTALSNLNKGLLIFQYESQDSLGDPENNIVSGEITNTTTLTFERRFGGGAIGIFWWVIEFKSSSGVTVQRGSKAMGATTENVAITAVNLSNSFPVLSWSVVGTSLEWHDFVTGDLTSTTNLQLRVGALNNLTVKWQVVENPRWTVSKYTGTLPAGSTSMNVVISATVLSRSWLIGTARVTSVGGMGGDELPRFKFSSTTQITINRAATGKSFIFRFWVIDSNSNFQVLNEDDQAILSGNSFIVLTPVLNAPKSVVSMNCPGICQNTNETNTSSQGHTIYTSAQFNGANKVQVTRGSSAAVQIRGSWSLLTFI